MAEGDTKASEPQTLMDVENEQSIKDKHAHMEKIARVAREIDDILTRESLSCGDWGEIVEIFGMRIAEVVAVTQIKSLK